MRRREVITLLGGAMAAWPLAARAQPTGKVSRVGFFGTALNSPPSMSYYQAFLARLRELGFNEGQNLSVEYRAVDDARGPSTSVAELIQSRPDLIVAAGPELSLRTVVAVSHAIPIVTVAINFDPIARGYAASLARPGGNITGVVFQQLELARKQVELLTQACPGRTRLAVLFDVQTADQFSVAERTATSLNLQVQPLKLENTPYDFEAAFRTAAAGSAQMVLVLSSPRFIEQRSRIAELAIAQHLPPMFIGK